MEALEIAKELACLLHVKPSAIVAKQSKSFPRFRANSVGVCYGSRELAGRSVATPRVGARTFRLIYTCDPILNSSVLGSS